MNQDLDNLNNHAPPVYPGDGYGDLNENPDSAEKGLPPKRPDRGIPTKKREPSAYLGHNAPKPKLCEESASFSIEPRIGMRKSAEQSQSDDPPDSQKTESEADSPPPSKIARKDLRRPPEAVGGITIGVNPLIKSLKIRSDAKDDLDIALDAAGERIILSPVHVEKRLPMNEFTSARQADTKRVPKMTPNPGISVEERGLKDVAKSRGRFARKDHDYRDKKNIPDFWRWMVFISFTLIAIVLALVFHGRTPVSKSDREKSSGYNQMELEDFYQGKKAEDSETLEMLTKGENEAKRIFATYATSKSVDDFIGLIYRADENGGLIAKGWEPLSIGSGWMPGQSCDWTVVGHEGLSHGVLSGRLPNFSVFRAYFRRDGESLKMDWKATAAYSSEDFAELTKGRGDGGEIRAILAPANFYTFAMPEDKFHCFMLMSPDGNEKLWAYTEIGGELDGKLLSQFVPSQITGEAQMEIAAVLGLERSSSQSLPNQWMITKLVRLNWLDE